MFDACNTPSVSAMQAWLASPYRSYALYIGGLSRGCNKHNTETITRSWVSSVSAMGWSLVPTYVGRQPECAKYGKPPRPFTYRISTNEKTAASQGAEAALDAIVQMKSLGLDASNPIYLDVEHYTISDGPCSVGVRAFSDAWTATLHAKGYLSGFYSSASSGIHHINAWSKQPGFNAPDYVWFARWNGVATADEPELDEGTWAGRRIHQFLGAHYETWGGVTINIDSNYVQSFTTPPSTVSTVTPRIAWDSKTASVGTKPVPVAIAGKFGIPADATAVIINVQIASPTGPGDLIVEPYRGTTKLTNQQFQKGQYVSTTLVVPVSQKVIQFRTTASTTRLVVGITGYLSNTGTDGITAVNPHILWDSKTPSIGQQPAGLAIRGVGAIPEDATAAILNVQVAGPTASGQLIVEPHGVHSTIGVQQYTKGRSISATVIVPLTDPAVDFRLSAGNARVIVSALGYLSPSSTGRLTATNPTLVWDSRTPKVTPTAVGIAMAGRNGMPSNATAALVNVEVVNPAAAGQLIVEPYGTRSNSGVQQFIKGQSISTTVLVPLTKGVAQLRISAGKARVIVSTLGYVTDYVAPPPDDDSGDDTDSDTDGSDY